MDLDRQLTELESAHLVRRTAQADPSYIFNHALTQETAYASLLKQSRREIHRHVAESIEQIYRDRLDDYAPLLAQHYAKAGVELKTFEYSYRAGRRALQTYAGREAIVHFTRAIDAARGLEPSEIETGTPAESPLTDCYLQRGRALEITGQFDQALDNYRELESRALARDDRAMQLAALVARATLYATATAIADPAQARTLSNRALELARAIADRRTEARVLWNLMLLSTMLGEMAGAVEYAEQSLAISRELEMREQTALTLNDVSRAYLSLGQFDRALAALQEALGCFRATNNQPMLADSLGRLAGMNLALGKFDEMLATAHEAQQIGEAIGNLWSQSFSRMFVGRVHFERGDMAHALASMHDCIRLAEQSGFVIPQVKVRSELALVYGALGQVRQGLELAEQAHALALERLPGFECKACSALARLYVLDGDLVRAEANWNRAVATLQEDFAQQVADQIPVAEMEIALAKKDYARAIETGAAACKRFQNMGLNAFRGELLYLQARALHALGNEEAARRMFLDAKTEAEKIGSRWMLWQIHAALGERAEAGALVDYIGAHAPPDWRSSFLNGPKVHAVMER